MAKRGDANNAAFEITVMGSKTVGRLELRLWQILTSGSPVRTGFFRSRWTPRIGPGLNGGEKPPADTRQARGKASAALAVNEAEARRIASSYQLRQGRITISNPTVYGPKLAMGSSEQAKKGWIERAITKAINSLI